MVCITCAPQWLITTVNHCFIYIVIYKDCTMAMITGAINSPYKDRYLLFAVKDCWRNSVQQHIT